MYVYSICIHARKSRQHLKQCGNMPLNTIDVFCSKDVTVIKPGCGALTGIVNNVWCKAHKHICVILGSMCETNLALPTL